MNEETLREKVARFLYYTVCERAGIWGNVSDLPRHQFLTKADKLLALIRSEGYVKLVPVQRLPYTDEATGDDLGLDQIRIVKQMWKDGYRLVELEAAPAGGTERRAMSEEILEKRIRTIVGTALAVYASQFKNHDAAFAERVKDRAVAEIHEAYLSQVKRAGEVEIDPHNYTNPTAIKVGIAMQQTHILKRLAAQSFETVKGER